jgi:hypothetical protein
MIYANIKFDFGNHPKSDIRVSFIQRGGHKSRLGNFTTDLRQDQPTMNLDINDRTEEDEFSRSILHEFGHALGMVHEHQNPAGGIPWDKDKVYEYYLINEGWDSKKVDINVLGRYSKKHMNFSEFDPDSIMMYEVPACLTTNGQAIRGHHCKLSEGDKSYIATLYPGDVSMPTATPRQSAEPILTGRKHIITNVMYGNAAFIEGADHAETLMAKYERNIPAEQVSRSSFAIAGWQWLSRISATILTP